MDLSQPGPSKISTGIVSRNDYDSDEDDLYSGDDSCSDEEHDTFILNPRLTKLGLIRILIDKLDIFVMKYGKPHVNAESVSAKNNTKSASVSQDGKLKRKLTVDTCCKWFSGPGSSDASPMSSGSGSMSPVSYPRSLTPPHSEDSPMAVYSPICSVNDDDDSNHECDDNEDDDVANIDNINDRMFFHEILPENEQKDEELNLTSACNELQPEQGYMSEGLSIVYALYKVSHVDAYVDDLATKRTTMTLMQYIVKIRHSNKLAVKFFRSLVLKEHYYCELLDNYFALDVHRTLCRPTHTMCSRCDELKEIGELILSDAITLSEAGLGEGQMAFRLLTSNDDIKLRVALTVPFVLRGSKLLLKMLVKYKALDMITSRLSTYTNLTFSSVEDVAYSLRMLFIKLKYEYPKAVLNAEKNHCCPGCDIGSLRKESSIVFSLDDGSIVPANKTILCNKSPVFDAMLNGNFKESEQCEIKIREVSEKCLQHFVKLIDTYCECMLPDDVNVLLELISVSDRYLANKLVNDVALYVMTYKISYENCHIIFKWAKECKLPLCEKISSDVIKFLFTSDMSCKQLRKGLLGMMDSSYRNDFITDFIQMIKDALYLEANRSRS